MVPTRRFPVLHLATARLVPWSSRSWILPPGEAAELGVVGVWCGRRGDRDRATRRWPRGTSARPFALCQRRRPKASPGGRDDLRCPDPGASTGGTVSDVPPADRLDDEFPAGGLVSSSEDPVPDRTPAIDRALGRGAGRTTAHRGLPLRASHGRQGAALDRGVARDRGRGRLDPPEFSFAGRSLSDLGIAGWAGRSFGADFVVMLVAWWPPAPCSQCFFGSADILRSARTFGSTASTSPRWACAGVVRRRDHRRSGSRSGHRDGATLVAMSSGLLAIETGPDPTNASPLERLGHGGPVVGIVM